MPKIAVIGSGFSGLSAAAYAAKAGNEVHVFERHGQPGGRARQLRAEGFVFDMGPSWYWMPDIINDFFADFGHKTSDFFELVALNPQFEIIFQQQKIRMPHSYQEMRALFDNLERGAAQKLDEFMAAAETKYYLGMKEFAGKPCLSWTEFFSLKNAKNALKLDLFSNYRKYVSKFFTNPMLRTIMEFPVIFLGASPTQIPALYSLMNFGGYKLGTHYPMGGFFQLVLAMKKVAELQGAHFHFNHEVEEIKLHGKKIHSLRINGKEQSFDAVIATGDYHHMETLLPAKFRNYNQHYWANRVFAPSCLIYYIGLSEKIPGLQHHTLFFEHDLDEHISAIYQKKCWPENPLFYACCPSKTDASVAPAGKENLFLLMPLAIGLKNDEQVQEKYLKQMLARIEKLTGTSGLFEKIAFKKSYCVQDFIKDYHAFGGNAYGLANTLRQTAVLKPKIKNRHLKNLFYAGQLTVPGPGVPPTIISGKIAATEINKTFRSHEKTI